MPSKKPPPIVEDQLAKEAALRAKSLARTRKLQARARQRQRKARAARLVAVGQMVEACGLLWMDDARLQEVLLAVRATLEWRPTSQANGTVPAPPVDEEEDV